MSEANTQNCEFLTAQEVAAALKLSPKNGWRTVLTWADSGNISFMRFGRVKRFRLADFAAWGYKNGSGGELNKRYLGHR